MYVNSHTPHVRSSMVFHPPDHSDWPRYSHTAPTRPIRLFPWVFIWKQEETSLSCRRAQMVDVSLIVDKIHALLLRRGSPPQQGRMQPPHKEETQDTLNDIL